MQLEDAFAPIGTLVGANTTKFDELTGSLKDMMGETPASAEDLGSAAYMTLSAGITDTATAMDVLRQSNDLALAGLGDLGQANDLVTSAMNSFKGEGLDAEKAAKTFFGTIASGKTTTADLASGFGQIAPLASAAGVQFNDLMAATSALTSTGQSASVAYSGIKGALTSVLKPTAEASQMAEKLGLNFSAAHLKAVGLPKFLDEVKVATGGNTETMAQLFGSVEGLNAVLALTGPQAEAFTANLTGIADAGGNLSVRAEEMANTTSNQWKMLKNEVTVRAGEIGQKISGYLIEKFGELREWWSKNGDEIKAKIGELWEAARPVFDAIGEGIKTLMDTAGVLVGWFKENWPAISEELGKMWEAAEPIFTSLKDLVSSVFEAIKVYFETYIAVIQDLWDRFGSHLIEHFQTAWDAIMQIIQGALDVITGIFDFFVAVFTGDWGAAWDAIKKIVGGVWDVIVGIVRYAINLVSTYIGLAMAGISAAWGFVWNSIKTLLSDIWEGIKSVVGGAIDWVKDRISTVMDSIKTIWSSTWTGIKDFFSGIWDGIKNYTKDSLQRQVDFIKEMPGKIKDAAKGMWDGIKDAFTGAINFIIDGWNGLEFKIPGFKVGPVGYDGFTLGVPDIPRLATGAFVRMPTLAMIGDSPGGEWAVPEGKADAFAMARVRARGLDGGTSRSSNVTVYATVSEPVTQRELAREITKLEALVS